MQYLQEGEQIMDFAVFDSTISFTDKQLARAKVLKVFGEYADVAEELTKLVYLNKINSYKDLLSDNGAIIQIVVNMFFEPTMSFIVSNGIYDFSDTDLYSKFKDQNTISEMMEEILEPFDKIIQANGSMQQYRELRKESRGRVVGGGFGFGGAVKGMATAGAMNLAAGIGHSIINSIGNAIDNAAAEEDMTKLFKDENLITDYTRIAMVNVLHIGDIVLSLFEKKGLISTECNKKPQDNSLFENLKKGRIPPSEVPKIFLTLIKNSPHEREYYEWGAVAFPKYEDVFLKMRDTMCYQFQFLSTSIKKPEDITHFDRLVLEKAHELLGIDYIAQLTAPKSDSESDENSTSTLVLSKEEKKAIEDKKTQDNALDMAAMCVAGWASLILGGITYGIFKPYLEGLRVLMYYLFTLLTFAGVCLSALCLFALIGSYCSKMAKPEDPTNKPFKGSDFILAILTVLPFGILYFLSDTMRNTWTCYALIGVVVLTAVATVCGILQMLVVSNGSGKEKTEVKGEEVEVDESNEEESKETDKE